MPEAKRTDYDAKPATAFTAQATALITEIKGRPYSVLCGRNNCGKSFLLKSLKLAWQQGAAYLGPARYQNFNLLGNIAPRKSSKVDEEWNQWYQQWHSQNLNVDNSPFSLQQAIAELSDAKRDKLFEIMNILLGSKMEILFTIDGNRMSQQYISVDGHNIAYTSSGYRLICTLVTSLLNEDYEHFLIDEPELGISPEAQGVFADFLFNRELRAKYFAHVKSLVFATHSTAFLDRRDVANNYFVSKAGDLIDLSRSASVSDINRIHFFLLGNRLESIYMPAAIVIVEGKCDYKFIDASLRCRYPETKFSLIQANGDTRIRDIFSVAKSIFGDVQISPYNNRIFAVLDSVHGTGLVSQLQSMGIIANHIVVWPKNGIEYCYPPSVIEHIFHSTESLVINGDQVSCSGISYTKIQLVDLVVPYITSRTSHQTDFENLFLKTIEEATGISPDADDGS